MTTRNIIIPAGTLNANHTNIIEIPEQYRNVSTLIATSRNTARNPARTPNPFRSLPAPRNDQSSFLHQNISQPMASYHLSCPTGQPKGACPAGNVTYPPPAGHPVRHLDRSRAIPETFRDFLPTGASSFKEYEGPKFKYGRNESLSDSYSGGSSGVSGLMSGSGSGSGSWGSPHRSMRVQMCGERVQSDPALGLINTRSTSNIEREFVGHVGGAGSGAANYGAPLMPPHRSGRGPARVEDHPMARSSPPLVPLIQEDYTPLNMYEDFDNSQEFSEMEDNRSGGTTRQLHDTTYAAPHDRTFTRDNRGAGGSTGYPNSSLSSGYASCGKSSSIPSSYGSHHGSHRSRSDDCMCRDCCAAKRPPPCHCGR